MSVMVLAATMTSVSESSAKHRRGMAGVENYELSSWHVPGLSGLHLRCAGGRLYSPTRIRRRLVVYPGACVMRVPPVRRIHRGVHSVVYYYKKHNATWIFLMCPSKTAHRRGGLAVTSGLARSMSDMRVSPGASHRAGGPGGMVTGESDQAGARPYAPNGKAHPSMEKAIADGRAANKSSRRRH